MVLGVLVALLLNRLGTVLRTLVSVGLLLAWAMPPLSATIVWGWIFDTQYGVLNYVLTQLVRARLRGPLLAHRPAQLLLRRGDHHRLGRRARSSPSPSTRGSTQVPDEVLEAAQLDGAGGVKRFFLVVVPVHPADPRDRHDPAGHLGSPRLHPDLRAAVDRRPRRADQHARRLHLPRVARLGRLRQSAVRSRSSSCSCSSPSRSSTSARPSRRRRCDHRHRIGTGRDVGSAAPAAARPPRPRIGAASARSSPASPALIVFVASVFPVYWMVNTSFQPNAQVRGSEIHFWPDNVTLENYTNVIIAGDTRAPFLPALVNSLAVTLLTVVVALVFAFLAALAVTRFRFRSPRGLHHRDPHRPDDPGRGDDHLDLPADRRLAPAQHAARAVGRLHRDGPPVHDLDAARLRQRRSGRSRRGRDDRRAQPRRRRSGGSPSRCWRPASSPPASSASSRRGTSSCSRSC